MGAEIERDFSEKGLEGIIEKVAYPTGTVQVSLDDNGVPNYTIKENVAWDNIPFITALKELAQHTCAVSYGSLAQRNIVSRETIHAFLDAMPKEGAYKIFDINLRQNFYTKDIIC
mgnify:FL=1